MCTYHYLHHHHIPPCPKDLYFVIHYLFCPDATTIDLSTGNRQPCNNAIYDDSHLASTAMSASISNSMSNSISTLSTSPTSSQSSASTTSYYSNDGTSFPVDYTSLYSSTASMSLSSQQQQQQTQTMDFNNPCASSTCLTSLECSSGQCRLEQLGGKWTCCRCGGKGNEYAWCKARPGLVRGADPDMVCYHVVCGGCRASSSSHEGSSKKRR